MAVLEALEKDLYVDVNEKSRKKILDMFFLGRSLQIPVLDNGKIVGILDLFDYLQASQKNREIADIMETDIVVAGEERGVFSFASSNQGILPFVDTEGRYKGYINRITIKCYLPSKEYMQVIDSCIEEIGDGGEVDYSLFEKTFDAVFERNYDGVFITTRKGITYNVNEKARYVPGLTAENITINGKTSDLRYEEQREIPVSMTQILQNKNEASISDFYENEGGIVKIINNLKDLKKEIASTKELALKYQNEVEFLKWEDSQSTKIVAKSPEIRQIVNLCLKVASVDSTVLLQGPSGVGKGVLTELIHKSSKRKDNPFVKIDCSAIPENLIESELFGYEPGAFTGADKNGKIGLLELADSGTVFLDEVGELPLNLQPKLLRVLQDQEVLRIGGSKAIPVDIRVIAATNKDLEKMVDDHSFREDLYYRLNVVPIRIPPLRDRREDILPLIELYLSVFNEKYDLQKQIEKDALKSLIDYSWPGNARELKNVIEYLVVTSTEDQIPREALPDHIARGAGPQKAFTGEELPPLKQAVAQLERELLMAAMRKSGSIEEMARLLQMDRTTIGRKLSKYGIRTYFR
ncbi:MAG: sigma 54-interacting transcriptional regulator [Bacillota bacterium]|nr:sigma 54-interacting transcriptional regulator [Bacillota bacterium]